MIRSPTPVDVPDLARIHVQAWTESYSTLLPESEHARRTIAIRTKQWTDQIARGTSRIAYAPGQGFAQSGLQRDSDLATQGYTHELYAMYLLDAAKGTGLAQDLFDAVRPNAPFTALTIAANTRAIRFYERSGATILSTRIDKIGEAVITEAVLAWR
jgi:GNAT superfamily N-acetyltransferase